jgi:DNA (cytosine-5)-methyltransferase 1
MTHVSLFSGIGGFDIAAEWAGLETILQVERDPYCLRVLRKHWPTVRRVHDVRRLNDIRRKVGARSVDVLSGGFPCQPFSVAGKRLGTADARNLWPRMFAVVECLRPTWIVAENVRGLFSWNGGVAFESVCADLESAGYEVLPLVYPVAGVGAPHLRYRAFVVAYSNEEGLEKLNRVGYGKAHGNTRSLGVSNLWNKRPPEPCIRRMDDGIPHRVDRVRALGNAVSPYQALPIFLAIVRA